MLGILLIFLNRGSSFFICTFSAFLHELGHKTIAEKYGYKMNKIRLMPFGAELHGDTDCFDGKDEIFISLAGPLVNFFICIILLGWWWINPAIYDRTIDIFETNLGLGIFNLLPLFPLDGGRILLSLLSQKTTRRNSAKIVKNITKIFAITLFMGFIITLFNEVNLTLGVMAFMLFFTASSSAKDAVYQKVSLVNLIQKKAVQWGYISVPETMKIYELKKLHIKNRVFIFIVLNGLGNEVFRFSEIDLERIESRLEPTKKVSEIKNFIGF